MTAVTTIIVNIRVIKRHDSHCNPAQKRGDIAKEYRRHAANRSVKKNRLNDRVTLSTRNHFFFLLTPIIYMHIRRELNK